MRLVWKYAWCDTFHTNCQPLKSHKDCSLYCSTVLTGTYYLDDFTEARISVYRLYFGRWFGSWGKSLSSHLWLEAGVPPNPNHRPKIGRYTESPASGHKCNLSSDLKGQQALPMSLKSLLLLKALLLLHNVVSGRICIAMDTKYIMSRTLYTRVAHWPPSIFYFFRGTIIIRKQNEHQIWFFFLILSLLSGAEMGFVIPKGQESAK
jgi:hypothetical protein